MDVCIVIQKTREDIFKLNFKDIFMTVVEIFEFIEKQMNNISNPQDKRDFSEILNLMNIAVVNEDYLLIADILKYELLPFYQEKCVLEEGLK